MFNDLQTLTKNDMKTAINKNISALAVSVIDEKYFTAPCFTLAEAARFTRMAQASILEDGGDNIAGSLVYHPIKGVVAWVSPNGRVWAASSFDDVCKGSKAEFTGNSLTQHFTELFV